MPNPITLGAVCIRAAPKRGLALAERVPGDYGDKKSTRAASWSRVDYPRAGCIWLFWLHELPVGQTCIGWCGVSFIDGRMGRDHAARVRRGCVCSIA